MAATAPVFFRFNTHESGLLSQSAIAALQETPLVGTSATSCVRVRLLNPTWAEEVTLHTSQCVPPVLSQVGGSDAALKVTEPRPRL
jgi:hypothetical protein